MIDEALIRGLLKKCFVLCITLLVLSSPVQAQQATKVPRIGFLSTAALSSLSPRLDAFRHGLRELGYIEDKNISIEYRSAEGKVDRLADLAAELVRFNVACIITAGENPTRAAKQATNTIPIIATTVADPVRDGFVASLSRPGGNVTGLSTYATDLSGKRLELLKETVPKLSRVAFFNDSRTTEGNLKEIEAAARLLKIQVIPLEVRTLGDLENAFQTSVKSHAGAFSVGASGFFNTNQNDNCAVGNKASAGRHVSRAGICPSRRPHDLRH
jgi:putative ABC transport system substrate-binding protein